MLILNGIFSRLCHLHVASITFAGVQSVYTDLAMQKVTVIGYVDPRKVIKAVRKTRKQAEFWNESFNKRQTYPYQSKLDDRYMREAPRYDYENYNNDYGRPFSYQSSYTAQHPPSNRRYKHENNGMTYSSYHNNDDFNYAYHGGNQSQGPHHMFSNEDANACSIM
ncbi:hypothetical protein KP509_07G002900 [Ceratopteris richardii]|uniref:HMA domain-containing protein n=1 Tax=Ceratopteris richardii TaxID=49495 RepID=A0A8T2UBI9_CERRI|nr:hypothetical protein KP509_07G002900 [Ceratopteris richardii]